jgi:hypothetical protein
MAKDRGNHGQDPQEIMHAAGSRLTWMTGMAEQNLRQSVTAMDEMLRTLRHAADVFREQATRFREQTAALAEDTMGNAAEFGSRMIRSKDPLEWSEAQSEFVSKQLEAVAERHRTMGEFLMSESTEMANIGVQQARQITHQARQTSRTQKRQMSRRRAKAA